MTDIRISDLDPSGNLLDDDVLVGVNGGQTRQIPLLQVASYIQEKIVNGVVIATSAPTPVVGKHWYNPNTKQTRVWDGSVWCWMGGANVISICKNNGGGTARTNTWTQLPLTSLTNQAGTITYVNGISHLSSDGFVKILEAGYYEIDVRANFAYNPDGGRGVGIYVGATDLDTVAVASTSRQPSYGLALVGNSHIDSRSTSTSSQVYGGSAEGGHSTTVLGRTTLPLAVDDCVTPVYYHSAQTSTNTPIDLAVNQAHMTVRLVGY